MRTANYEPTAMILAERTAARLGSLREDGDADFAGQYLAPPDYVKDIPRLSTGHVPTNMTVGTATDTSDIFVGDFSKLLIGIRTGFSLQVLDQMFAATGEVGFVGWLRADIQLARTDAFQIVSGIKA